MSSSPSSSTSSSLCHHQLQRHHHPSPSFSNYPSSVVSVSSAGHYPGMIDEYVSIPICILAYTLRTTKAVDSDDDRGMQRRLDKRMCDVCRSTDGRVYGTWTCICFSIGKLRPGPIRKENEGPIHPCSLPCPYIMATPMAAFCSSRVYASIYRRSRCATT